MRFREYCDLEEFKTFTEGFQRKPWKARRADVLRFWQSLRPNQPIQPTPVSKYHRGTKFREDGLRITGSPDFINGVLSRIKDLIQYDTNPTTKLEIEYRAIENKQGTPYDKPIYVCYIHVIQRKKAGES
jgi:hypothetical protein